MSARRWHRRVQYSQGPTGTAADRTIERTAIEAAGLASTSSRSCATAWARPRRRLPRRLRARHRPVLEHLPGPRHRQGVVISSTDPDVEARALRVTELPAALLAAWPRDDRGRPIAPGYDHGPRPAQGSLFG